MRLSGWIGLCLALGTGALAAQTPTDAARALVLRGAVAANVGGAGRIDDLVPLVVAFMRRDDVDGVPGLSMADAELRVRMDLAGRAGDWLQELLASDLDGNLAIHRAEAEAVALIAAAAPLHSAAGPVLPDPEQRQSLARRIADGVMVADANDDGVVTLEEIRARARVYPAPPSPEVIARRPAQQPVARIAALADADGDGNASPEELAAWVRQVLASVDGNGDGRLSRAEWEAAK